MGTFDGVPILGDVEKAWNDNVAKPINDTVVQPTVNWVADNTGLKQQVTDYVINNPKKAEKIINDPFGSSLTQFWKLKTGKRNVGLLSDEGNETVLGISGADGPVQKIEVVEPVIEQAIEESTQPIWDRDSTKKVLGEDGADKLQDVLNPARWGENAIDNLGVSDTTKDNLKKYLPVALAGGAALLLVTALR